HSNKSSKESAQLQQIPVAYIPFLPFAVIYICLRIGWDAFQLFVFSSLDAAEEGIYMLWNFIKWSLKTLPKVVATIPPLWASYIQQPFSKILGVISNWVYVYAWPAFKQVSITGWQYSVIVTKNTKNVVIISWRKGV